MVKYIMFLILFMSSTVRAGDQWLCTEEASQRSGDVISSCGIGESESEGEARSMAFDNAKAEFARICETSSDCVGHEISTHPKRTSCEQKNGKYKCYRLVQYAIGMTAIERAKIATTAQDRALTHTSTMADSIAELVAMSQGKKVW